jgi:2-polyprenyl-3-methyl-5-hydroxy-6-metoxy-1,4-benzoquinol methylase
MHSDILANLVRRQADFSRYLIPWINLRRTLKDATVVDVGCGTGSSTAALAYSAAHVHGYDIDESSVTAASARMRALRLQNVAISQVNPKSIVEKIKKDHPFGVDVICLIAVLEHMTVEERLVFLPEIWDYMRPGDVLVVAETPNFLNYNDDHTAQIPFFHMLNDKLKARYINRSIRKDFVDSVRELTLRGNEMLSIGLARWGVGVSFHDFEIGFNTEDLFPILLADGYEHPMLDWWPPQIEERILLEYFIRKPIEKPLGFCRNVLNLMFVKPHLVTSEPALRHSADYLARIWTQHQLPLEGLRRLERFAT